MILKFLRWLFGYVVFATQGPFTERFMNLTARSGMSMWDIKKNRNVFSACISVGEYKKIRGICKRSGVILKVKEKHGFPFFLNKYRNRVGLVVGIALFFGIMSFLSLYVWGIEVEGNVNIDTGEIKKVMSELGLEEGSLKRELDIPMIEQNAMMKLNNTAWLSINMKGSYATVSLKERIIPPDIVPQEKPCNVKAKCDGQIVRMEVYDGESVVKNGDAVAKGQLLVSGVVEDAFGGNMLKHADAKVYAYIKKEIHEEMPFIQRISEPTGKVVVRKRAKMFGIELPLTLIPIPKGNYKKETTFNVFRIGDASLPLSEYKEFWNEQVEHDVRLTREEAMKRIEKTIAKREKDELKDCEVIEKNRVERTDSDKCYIDIEYYCKADISYKEEIGIQ